MLSDTKTYEELKGDPTPKYKKKPVGILSRLVDEEKITRAKYKKLYHTPENEKDRKIPFLDTLIVRRDDGTIKLLVYRKATHTDQYLNFSSHHPLHQKLGVVRTLLDRKNKIITEDRDKEEEEVTIKKTLSNCGYPSWSFDKVKQQMDTPKQKKKAIKKDETTKSKGLVVIPYVEGVSERIARTFKSYNISAAMKPHCTLRNMLVHPKNKRDPLNTTEVVYSIPCQNCNETYVGETWRKFGKRLKEHRAEADKACVNVRTRANRKASQSATNKSAITDHVLDKDHIIDWEEAKILGKEADRYKRGIKEAVKIRQQGTTVNRDEGQYNLTHVFDDLLKKATGNRVAEQQQVVHRSIITSLVADEDNI
ncbi:uncharacterized protein [Amphiura filiformis]|uniref:uncharacterized protein n=1 Tax=Amphiura filiformis TaxID=82378 RepID=UPI003B222D34